MAVLVFAKALQKFPRILILGDYMTVFKRVKRAAKKRYFQGKGYSKPKLVQMAKDVTYLKSVLNPEKKLFAMSNNSLSIGQVSGNANGFYAVDITPIPAQGTTSITRNGNSLKLHSTFMRFQFQQQTATTNPIKIRMYVVLVKGTPNASVGTYPSGIMFDANPFVTGASIYDYHSSMNADYFGTYKILRKKELTIKTDTIAGNNSITDVTMPMKYFRGKGHHIRFAADGSQTIADGQLILVLVADTGNISSSTACTLPGVANGSTPINTGSYFAYNIQHYFYDN